MRKKTESHLLMAMEVQLFFKNNTMKNIIYILITAFLLAACDKDESVRFTKEIKKLQIVRESQSIKLEIGAENKFAFKRVYYLDAKKDTIDLKLGEGNFKWEWYLNKAGYDLFLEKVSEGDTCRIIATTDQLQYSALTLKITDTISNAVATRSVKVGFLSNFGRGLVVADTKDGITTNFHEIRTSHTAAFWDKEEEIIRNIYPQRDYLVKTINYDALNNIPKFNVIALFSDNKAYRTDGTFMKDTASIFLYYPSEIKNVEFFNVSGGTFCALVNGKVYNYNRMDGILEGPISAPNDVDYNIAHVADCDYGKGAVGYDQINNKFWRIQYSLSGVKSIQSDETLINWNDCGNYYPLHLDNIRSYGDIWAPEYMYAVMKEKNGSNILAYTWNYKTFNEHRIVDLSDCQDIDKAEFFCSTYNQRIMYYGYDNKIYATNIFGSDKPVSFLVYQTEDKMTNLQGWTHGSPWFTQYKVAVPEEDHKIKAKNRMLYVTTYNESTKEGKIVFIPIKNLDDAKNGLVTDPEYIHVHGGFGRILTTSKTANDL